MNDKPQGDSERCQSSGLLGIKHYLLHSECWGELFGGDKKGAQTDQDLHTSKPKSELGRLVAQVNAQQIDGKDKPDKTAQDKNTVGNRSKGADSSKPGDISKPGDTAVQNPAAKAPEQKPESPNQAELTATANKAGSDTQSGEMASTAKALQAIADDPKLFEKLTGGRNTLTKGDLERALVLNGEVLQDGGRPPDGIADHLTDAEKQSVTTLLANWERLKSDSLSRDQINKFNSTRLGRDLDRAMRQSVGPTTEMDIVEFLRKKLDLHPTVPTPTRPGQARPNAQPQSLVTLVSPEDFSKKATALFDKLDTNKNGFLTTRELSEAISDPQYKGQDAQVLAALYRSRNELTNNFTGISKGNLDVYAKTFERTTQALKEGWQIERIGKDDTAFARFDKGKNGYVTKEDLLAVTQDKSASDYDRESAQAMLKHFSRLTEASDDYWFLEGRGVTAADMKKFPSTQEKSEDTKLVKRVASTLSRTYFGQRRAVTDLYGNEKDPLGSITADGVDQGTIGDCYFLAALASVANSNPQQIKDMIKDNGNGTYTVTFPNTPGEPFTVSAPTEAELGLYNQSGRYGTWSTILEKAFGAYRQSDVFRRPSNLGGGNTVAEGADGGGFFGPIRVLTGKNFTLRSTTFNSQDELARQLNDALNNGQKRAVVASVGVGLPFWSGETTQAGFQRSHMYSILAFDPKGKDGGTVTVRNPWGGEKGTVRGQIDISLKEFAANFENLALQNR